MNDLLYKITNNPESDGVHEVNLGGGEGSTITISDSKSSAKVTELLTKLEKVKEEICNLCDKLCKSSSSLLKHTEVKQSGFFACTFCNETSYMTTSMHNHVKGNHFKPLFGCELCNETLSSIKV